MCQNILIFFPHTGSCHLSVAPKLWSQLAVPSPLQKQVISQPADPAQMKPAPPDSSFFLSPYNHQKKTCVLALYAMEVKTGFCSDEQPLLTELNCTQWWGQGAGRGATEHHRSDGSGALPEAREGERRAKASGGFDHCHSSPRKGFDSWLCTGSRLPSSGLLSCSSRSTPQKHNSTKDVFSSIYLHFNSRLWLHSLYQQKIFLFEK